MPKYSYKCKKCKKTFSMILSYSERNNVHCPDCFSKVDLSPPILNECIVNEVKDRYRNKAIKRDINKIMKDRSVNHIKNHELGELIERHGSKSMKKSSFWKGKK